MPTDKSSLELLQQLAKHGGRVSYNDVEFDHEAASRCRRAGLLSRETPNMFMGEDVTLIMTARGWSHLGMTRPANLFQRVVNALIERMSSKKAG